MAEIDPRELAVDLCEQIISDGVHDTIMDFLAEALDERPTRELIDEVYKLAHSAIITIPEEEK